MSFADKFYSVLLVYVLSSLSYIGEILCILSVIFIMISFLGVKGEVTRKTFIPGYIFAGMHYFAFNSENVSSGGYLVYLSQN